MAEKAAVPARAKAGKKTKKAGKETVKKTVKRKRAVVAGPAVRVKAKFGSKESLIKEVKKIFDKADIFIDKLNKNKGLERVSNRKLLRLYEMAAEVKEKFGNRKALIDEYVKLASKENVQNISEKLSSFTIGKLLDLYHQAARRAGKTT
jgi:hypothetical protein